MIVKIDNINYENIHANINGIIIIINNEQYKAK